MPASWEILSGEGLARVRLHGPTDLAGAIDTMIRVTGSPDFSPDFRVIVDLRDIEYQPTIEEVMEFGAALNALRGLIRNRVAIVTADPTHYHLAQIISALALAAGLRQRAFRDLAEAERWLASGAD